MGRSGFARTLVFAALASLGLLATRLLMPGSAAAVAVYLVALVPTYLAAVAPSRRAALSAALLTSLAGVVVLCAATRLAEVALGAAILLSVGRSALLYRRRVARALLVELSLGVGGLLLARLLVGPGPAAAALALWGYGLVQSVYFLLADLRERAASEPGDPFDRARERLLVLLDERAP